VSSFGALFPLAGCDFVRLPWRSLRGSAVRCDRPSCARRAYQGRVSEPVEGFEECPEKVFAWRDAARHSVLRRICDNHHAGGARRLIGEQPNMLADPLDLVFARAELMQNAAGRGLVISDLCT
jgi:hypothetical protein